MHYVPVVGLVGGVGSGKSSVARWAACEFPPASSVDPSGAACDLKILSGDEAGHSVLRIPSVLEAVRHVFGDSAFDSHGQIMRAALADRVFGPEPDQVAARRQLEEIVHPRIRDRLEEEIQEACRHPEIRAVILDAAVLFEAGWNTICDAVVFIDTPLEVRQQRVRESRGWSEDDLRRREQSQWPLDRKRAAADGVLDNSGSPQETARQLRQWIERLIASKSKH